MALTYSVGHGSGDAAGARRVWKFVEDHAWRQHRLVLSLTDDVPDGFRLAEDDGGEPGDGGD